VPLRVYSADHVLIGEVRRGAPQTRALPGHPDVMKKAVLAIEDDRFYEHGGVDFLGILRAGVADLLHGGARQGASTITMQVARNFFLSSEKTYTRKIYEMLLAYKIERALTKDQILELYMNQIYLGQRAYGFAARARVLRQGPEGHHARRGGDARGLPKAPSAYNPVVNPKRAKVRQEYILKRMLELGYITQPQYDQAVKEEIHVRTPGNEFAVHAEYVAEMVRQMMYAQYKDETYTRGLTVTTTINAADQKRPIRPCGAASSTTSAATAIAGRKGRSICRPPATIATRRSTTRSPITPTTAICNRPWCCRHRRMRSTCSSSAARPRRSGRPACASCPPR
jgi:penicillin-binding protein 1A